MSDISIDKKTGISLGLLIVLAPAIFFGIATWTKIQSQTDRNTTDIVTLTGKIDTLNDNLSTTNGNIIELNTKLDGLTARQTTTKVEVTPSHNTSTVYVQPPYTTEPQSSEQSTQQPQLQRPQSPQTQTAGEPNRGSTVARLISTATDAISVLKLD